MAVEITWSLTNGGAAIAATLDHGSKSNGEVSTANEVHVRHDHTSNIVNAGVYARAYSGVYTGTFAAATDFAELLAWGDGATADAFGGLQWNFLATSSYASTGWPTQASKSPAGGLAIRTGVGDSIGNAFTIPTTTGATGAGEIQTGSSPNVRFQIRVQVPTDEDTVGIRQWDQALTFTYTT